MPIVTEEHFLPSPAHTTSSHGVVDGKTFPILISQGEMINISPQLSLLLADVLQAIGGILSVKWIYDGKVVVGSFCNAQGIPCAVYRECHGLPWGFPG